MFNNIIDIDEMRNYISNVYPGNKWKIRVERMPPKQVMAVFFSFMERIKKRKKSESLKAIEMGEALVQGFARGISEGEYEQISFEDILGGMK